MHDLLRSPQVGPRWSVLHDMLGDDVHGRPAPQRPASSCSPRYSDEELIAGFHDLLRRLKAASREPTRPPDRRAQAMT